MSLDSRGFGLLRRLYRNIPGRQRTEQGYKKTDFASMESMEPRLMMSAAPVITSVSTNFSTEGQQGSLSIDFTDADVTDEHTVTINWGDGNESHPGISYSAPGAGSFTSYHTYTDNYSDTVYVTIADELDSTTRGYGIMVGNTAPTFVGDNNPVDAIFEGGEWEFEMSFADAGTGDTHTAIVDWGDGSDPESLTVNTVNGLGTISGNHTYGVGGEYTPSITVTDDDNGELTHDFDLNYAVPHMDIIFVLDTTGSIQDDQLDWLKNTASDLDTALSEQGFIARYGVVEFTNDWSNIPIATAQDLSDSGDTKFGDIDELCDYFESFIWLDGGYEDGYGAIDYVFDNYNLSDSSEVRIILVTDEDRDDPDHLNDDENNDNASDQSDLITTLSERDVVVDAIVNIGMFDADGEDAFAINSDGDAAVLDFDNFQRFLINYNDDSSSYVASNTSTTVAHYILPISS